MMVLALLQIAAAAAMLQGRVVEWGKTVPIAQAEVELLPLDSSTGKPFVAVTTTRGEYRFSNVPPGRYRLIAMRPGFSQGEYGQRRPGAAGTPVTVAVGRPLADITLTMAPGGTIAGRIADRDGRPMQRANVSAMRLSYVDGKPSLTTVQAGITNDRGEYRLFWLPPGPYYVSLVPSGRGRLITVNANAPDPSVEAFSLAATVPLRGGPAPRPATLDEREVYLPSYFPGVTELKSAVLINLRAGEEVRDVNIATAIQIPARLSVAVIDASTGLPPESTARVVLVPSGARSPAPNILKIGSAVAFDGLLPGVYEIRAGIADNDIAGRSVVQVLDRDLDVTIALGTVTLAGRVRIENAAEGFNLQQAEVVVRGEPAFRTTASIGSDGTFLVSQLTAGDYQVAVSDAALREYYVKSIHIGPADVLGQGLRISAQPAEPLDIVLSGDGGELTGFIVNDRSEPVAEATVVMVPNVVDSTRRLDLYKTAVTGSDGRFQIRGIAPAEYAVFAWTDVDTQAWLDPNFVNLYRSAGSTIRVSRGEKVTIRLVSIP